MCRKCGSKCNKDIYADDLYVCGDIYAKTSTLFISTVTTGSGVPVKICSLSTDTITPCTTGAPITLNGSLNITGNLSVAGTANFINYNLTNTNADLGVSLLGPLTGPGGFIRSFKTLTSDAGTITLTTTGTNINLESTNTGTVTDGANEGIGAGVFDPVNSTAATLVFKTITSSNGSIVVTSTPTTINLTTLNNGTVTGAANDGAGVTVFNTLTSTPSTLHFKSLTSTGGTVTIVDNGNSINFEAGTVRNGANEGAGTGIFDPATSTATTLRFKSLTSSNGSVVITSTATTVNLTTLNNGTVTGGVNDGPGFAVFNPPASTPTTLHFRTLTSTGGTVVITATATTLNLEAPASGTVTGASNQGAGTGFYNPAASTPTTLAFKTLTSTGGTITITSTPTTVNIESSNAGGTVTGAVNEGAGTGFFDPVNSTANTLAFKTLTSTGGSVTITSTANTVNIESNTSGGTVTGGVNDGPGFGVFNPPASTPTTLHFRTLTSTGGTVIITPTATTLNLEAAGSGSGTVTGATNEGAGTGFFDPATSTATTLAFKTLTSTGGSVAITSTATTVNIESNTSGGTVTGGVNDGPGVAVFNPPASTPTTLHFRTLTSTGGTVVITATANTINLEATGSGGSGTVTGGVNEGPGAGFFDPATSTATTLAFKTLTSTGGSVAITSTATTVNIESNNSGGSVTGGANEGPGFGVFDPTTSTATTLRFRTLTSTGGSVIITNNGTSLNFEAVASGGTVTNGANEGTGAGVFDGSTSTPTTLNFRTLTSTGGTLAITNVGNTVNFETTSGGTVTNGANEGTGVGIFDGTTSTPTTLNFRTLTSTGGTLAITNAGNTINLEAAPTTLQMQKSIFLTQPTPTSYAIQSVFGEPSNMTVAYYNTSQTISEGQWNLISLSSGSQPPVSGGNTSSISPYFQIINTNFIGPVTSPTSGLEAPGDGYDGTFWTEINWSWNIDTAFNNQNITNAWIIVSPVDTLGASPERPVDFGSEFRQINPVDVKDTLFRPGGSNTYGQVLGNIVVDSTVFNAAHPYGVWIYYQSSSVSTLTLSAASGVGNIRVLFRPCSR